MKTWSFKTGLEGKFEVNPNEDSAPVPSPISPSMSENMGWSKLKGNKLDRSWSPLSLPWGHIHTWAKNYHPNFKEWKVKTICYSWGHFTSEDGRSWCQITDKYHIAGGNWQSYKGRGTSVRNTHLFHPFHSSCPGGDSEQFQADFCPQPHPLLSGNLLCHCLGVCVGSFHWIFVIYDFRGTQMLHFPKKPQKFSQKTWDLLAVRSVYPPLIQKTLKIWQYKLQPIDKDISRLC